MLLVTGSTGFLGEHLCRVLVERVEGFARVDQWQRAYEEINAFEEQLTGFGIIVLKFWLAITSDEQLRRFEHRAQTPYKQYKINAEDWRNREKWEAYEAAACEMIENAFWIAYSGDEPAGAAGLFVHDGAGYLGYAGTAEISIPQMAVNGAGWVGLLLTWVRLKKLNRQTAAAFDQRLRELRASDHA